jgi:hypothetical protein
VGGSYNFIEHFFCVKQMGKTRRRHLKKSMVSTPKAAEMSVVWCVCVCV